MNRGFRNPPRRWQRERERRNRLAKVLLDCCIVAAVCFLIYIVACYVQWIYLRDVAIDRQIDEEIAWRRMR